MRSIVQKLMALFFMIGSYYASAQTIDNTINLYGQNFPQEKIHIHFDKETYLPGETIWFKAYLLEENLPSTRSTNFYAGLYDENGKLIQQQLYPILSSSAIGHFDIPDTLQSSQLICRAYTSWMHNFDSTFLFTKAIPLINNKSKVVQNKKDRAVSLQLFPEGGDIIEGLTNTIAFKANYDNGLPFEINGVIKKQATGEVVMPIQSQHDGMGRFDLEINDGQNFYVEWLDDKGVTQKTYLPNAKKMGVSLKLAQQKDKIIFNLTNKLSGDSLHVLMYMYQKVFYKANIAVHAAEPFTAAVPTSDLPTGTAQLTIFNANWQPVAERIVFINNNEYLLDAGVGNTETSLQKRGKNRVEISVADTVPSNMSLSITDADINSDSATSNIITDFLLSGDIKGYVYNPVYYFSSDKAAKANLDLVMLTHGWRRYNWDNITIAKMPDIKYTADNYLMLYGQVNKAIANKLDKDELINIIIKAKDSTQNFYQVHIDPAGFIKKDGMIFYDTAKVFYSFKKNKLLNPQVALSASNYTYEQQKQINNYSDFLVRDTTGVKFNSTATLFNYYNSNKSKTTVGKNGTLQTVVVKNGGWHNWKNNPLLKMDERYTTGLFRTGNGTSIDVVHDEMASAKQDIYNYLSGKVGGLLIDYNGGKHFVVKDTKALLLFIDENEADNYQISQLNIDNIGYVKYIETYAGAQGIPHALAIYLKKGDDLIDHTPRDDDQRVIKIPGYSSLKEFYSPDYTQSNTTMGTDARTTLLWEPYIITDKNNLKIPVTFYNNDFTKRLRVVLEGINDDGKMIHIEKIIE